MLYLHKLSSINNRYTNRKVRKWCLLESSCNRPFSLVDYVFPVQIMWRYPGEYFLSKLDIFTLENSLFNEHDKDSNLLSIASWSVLGKKNRQAKKVYSQTELMEARLCSSWCKLWLERNLKIEIHLQLLIAQLFIIFDYMTMFKCLYKIVDDQWPILIHLLFFAK